MSEPTSFDHSDEGRIREVRVERDGHFVCIKRQVHDLDRFRTNLKLDPARPLPS